MRVTVVIPTRDRPQELRRAINSVLTQTFQDFEIIVVDSTPGETIPKMLELFNDDRIRCLRTKKRAGVFMPSYQRNIGIAASTGEFIAFLDDDDVWRPAKLERQLELQSDVRTCGFFDHKLGKEFLFKVRGSKPKDLPARPFSSASVLMARRQCFDKGGFDVQQYFAEDWEIGARLAQNFSFDYVPETLVDYYDTPHRLTNRTEPQRLTSDIIQILSIMERYYPGHPMICEYYHRLAVAIYSMDKNLAKKYERVALEIEKRPKYGATYLLMHLGIYDTILNIMKQ